MADTRYLKRARAQNRRGLAVVETALVLPLLLWLTFGVIEYGWMFLKAQQTTNTARSAVRLAVTPDATNAQVTTLISNMMTASGITGYTTAVTNNSGGATDVSAVAPGQILKVNITVPYAGVGLGMPLIPTPANLTASVSMAKEGP